MEALSSHLLVCQVEPLLTSSGQRGKEGAQGRSYRKILWDKPGNSIPHSAHNMETPGKQHLIAGKGAGQCSLVGEFLLGNKTF